VTLPERSRSTARRPGRPSADDAAPDESVILQRGLEAFAELGYDRASARELARRLGVSHNFINDRYGSKAKFWRAVVDRALTAHRRDRVAFIEVEDDDAAHLRAVIVNFYRRTAEAPLLGRLMDDEYSRETERLDYIFSRYVKPEIDAITPTIERLVAAKRIAPVAMDVLFFVLSGPVSALVQMPLARRLGRPETEPQGDLVNTAEQLAMLVVDGLFATGPAFSR
jgi:AcrR family transcriptional regulator